MHKNTRTKYSNVVHRGRMNIQHANFMYRIMLDIHIYPNQKTSIMKSSCSHTTKATLMLLSEGLLDITT